MAAQERVVAHALLDYVDPDGVRHVAVRGDKVRIGGTELERAEYHGALQPADFDTAAAEPAPVVEEPSGPETSPPGATPDPAVTAESTDGDVERPAKAAPKEAWVDYAVSQGDSREDAEQATKQELIDKYGD